MAHSGSDTETLVALVASLLHHSDLYDEAAILDTLVDHLGNVESAASHLNARAHDKQGQKRKRFGGLDEWLSPAPSSKTSKRKPLASSSPLKSEGASITSEHGRPSVAIQSKQKISPPITKPTVDLMNVLQPPAAQGGSSTSRPPMLTLSTPAMVAQLTPCTFHKSILPQELACRLFHTMVDKSQSWKKNQWLVAHRMTESNHLTGVFARDPEDAVRQKVWYNGHEAETPPPFLAVMEEACALVETVVNEEILKRKRLPLEWDGVHSDGKVWRANYAVVNYYEGAKSTMGYHSDQMTYLGPCPTIASLSLGTSRVFRLREVIPIDEAGTRSAQSYNVPLSHNSLIIMHASTQEKFKHTVPPQSMIDVFRPSFPHPERPNEPPKPSTCRINITFRFFRPDYASHTTPRCKCGFPTVLRADQKRRDREGRGNIEDGEEDVYRYWWCCHAKGTNDGKGCGEWKVMDVDAEGRGPFVKDRTKIAQADVSKAA